ncbi:MAG: hypothetical protein P8Y40_12980 [Desulfobacterales bacterium]
MKPEALPRMTLRVLIVDDEPLARRGLLVRLKDLPDVSVVGECGNGRDAVPPSPRRSRISSSWITRCP